MKRSGGRRRLAGIVAASAVTAACAASSPAASSPAASRIACTRLPYATTPTAGTGGQRSRLDMPAEPGGLDGVAARSSSSALAVGWSGPDPTAESRRTRALVARWNGAAWRTLSSRALPPDSFLAAVALFRGGAWTVGQKGMSENGRVFFPLMVRVTGTTVRQVPIPRTGYGSALEDVAATSATDAWAVGETLHGPLILHWNGTAWTRVQLPATVAGVLGQEVDGVAAASRTNVWLVSLWRIVHWNGRRWSVISPDIGIPYALSSVAATSASNVWAVGEGRSKDVAVMLHWNGRRWTCAVGPNLGIAETPYFHAVSASSAANAWAVGGTFGHAVTLHWNGHAWEQIMIPQPNQATIIGWRGIALVPHSGHAWGVGNTDKGTQMWYWNGSAWR